MLFDIKGFGLDCDPNQLFNYSGTVSVTNKGVTCKDWMNDTEGTFDDSDFPDSDFPFDGSIANASNYCRDPRDMRVLPWCMINDPNLPWDYCNYPICNGRYNGGTFSTFESPSLFQNTVGKQAPCLLSLTRHR